MKFQISPNTSTGCHHLFCHSIFCQGKQKKKNTINCECESYITKKKQTFKSVSLISRTWTLWLLNVNDRSACCAGLDCGYLWRRQCLSKPVWNGETIQHTHEPDTVWDQFVVLRSVWVFVFVFVSVYNHLHSSQETLAIHQPNEVGTGPWSITQCLV